MRFHPLQRVHKKALASKIDFSVLCYHISFHFTSRPESMSHSPPRILRIRSEVAGPVLTHHKTWCLPCDGEINHAVRICGRCDLVCVSIFRELHTAIVGLESILLLVECPAFSGIATPLRRLAVIRIEYLAVELSGSSYTSSVIVRDNGIEEEWKAPFSPYVAVYYLGKSNVTFIGHEIEAVGLDIGGVHDGPFEIFLFQFSIRHLFCLFRNRLYGRRTVDRLLRAYDISEPT